MKLNIFNEVLSIVFFVKICNLNFSEKVKNKTHLFFQKVNIYNRHAEILSQVEFNGFCATYRIIQGFIITQP